MANREARLVPSAADLNPASYVSMPARLCPLCLEPLGSRATVWRHKLGDPPDVRRIMHALCAHERALLERAMGSR